MLAVAGFALLAVSLLGAATAGAVPITGAPARSTIFYRCYSGNPQVFDVDTLELDSGISASCDVTGSGSQGTGQAVTQGLTTFGFPAAADAQTSINVNVGTSTEARLNAQVRLDVGVSPLAPPPVPVTGIPVRISAPYSMNISVDKPPGTGGGSGAVVSLTVGIETVSQQLSLVPGSFNDSRSQGGTLIWSGVMDPAWGLGVTILANCVSSVSAVVATISSDCQSVIDPFFEFDQAAFDALMGEDSFELAHYFVFGVNENLGQPPVPVDLDRDGVENALDNCPYFPSADLADVNQNGIGNACECGDQNGDGRVNVNDLIAINLAIFNPSLVTPLCDTDNDGDCNVGDIVGANLKVFGRPAYCSRYPYPAP